MTIWTLAKVKILEKIETKVSYNNKFLCYNEISKRFRKIKNRKFKYKQYCLQTLENRKNFTEILQEVQ